MEGVTAALVAFIFVCIIFPHLIKHRAQYYTAVALVLLIVLLDVFPWTFFRIVIAVLQATSILLLILAAGGLSPRELAGEFANAYEVIRRGEEEKTVIVPLTGEQPKPKDQASASAPAPSVSPPPPPVPPDASSLPLA